MCDARKKLYEIIEPSNNDNFLSKVYDIFMMCIITISVIPLAFKETSQLFFIVDKITVSIFIVDYIFRLLTADYKFNKKSVVSFLKYPFTPLAIIDLISILPSLTGVNAGFKLLKIFRLLRTFRVFRTFKFLRYSKSIRIIVRVFQKQKRVLLTVATLAVAYILISALVIFNVEPESFQNFFDAVYWATVSLTTVGYGDIYPVTTIGRIITMVSSIFGIAIVALPSGIITAGFLSEIEQKDEK